MERRTRDVWLVLWGIFVALVIQSVADYVGSVYGAFTKLFLGVVAFAVASILLLIWILRSNRTKP